jgi:hypothetical protein
MYLMGLGVLFGLNSCSYVEPLPTSESTGEATEELDMDREYEFTELPSMPKSPGKITESADYDVGLATAGIINGEVYYNNIAISRFFTESFFDILGDPLGNHEERYFDYDGIHVTANWWDYSNWRDSKANQLNAWASDLHMFEINGITLDMNRDELIATLGNPLQRNAFTLGYRLSNPTRDYMLFFNFENLDDRTEITGIRIIEESGS